MAAVRKVAPAQYDRATQHRRAMLAKINIARHQLAMDEDDYRQGLFSVTGYLSLKECTNTELEAMLKWLKGKGFKALPAKAGKAAAAHPAARKARALWISLYHLGAVHNPAEAALEAFARRQLGCEQLSWARQSDAFRLIEALKAMAVRGGWRQADASGKPLAVLALEEGLCEAILVRLRAGGVVPDDWSIAEAAWKLCGIANAKAAPWSGDDYQRLAAALGAKLREFGATAGVQS